jgi:hypothetical protein
VIPHRDVRETWALGRVRHAATFTDAAVAHLAYGPQSCVMHPTMLCVAFLHLHFADVLDLRTCAWSWCAFFASGDTTTALCYSMALVYELVRVTGCLLKEHLDRDVPVKV